MVTLSHVLAFFCMSSCLSLTSVLLTKFIESIPDSQLVRQKLGCMCKMVESDLFKKPGTVVPLVKTQLYNHLYLKTEPHDDTFEWSLFVFDPTECRDVLLPLLTDQLSGQLDDHSNKPDHEACVQLLSTVLDNLDRKDVVSG